jgi:hypothetical protein
MDESGGRPAACPVWRDTVVDLVVGPVIGAAPSAARVREFHRHRAQCGACRSEYASALSLAMALGRSDELPSASGRNGDDAAPTPPDRSQFGEVPMKRHRGPLLTLLAVVGLAVVLLNINIARQAAPTAEPAAPAADAAPAGQPPAPAAAPPAAPAIPAEAAYAGRTSGNEATIAIAVKDGKAVAYLCDGKKIEAWLEGTVSGSTLSLQGPDGAAVTGELREGAVFGQAAAKGKQWPFSAALATPPAGAYRGSVSVEGVRKRIGWTVLQDGTVTGLVSDGSEAPPLDPATRTASLDGVPVDVVPVTGDNVTG